jgi:hypothetical protein
MLKCLCLLKEFQTLLVPFIVGIGWWLKERYTCNNKIDIYKNNFCDILKINVFVDDTDNEPESNVLKCDLQKLQDINFDFKQILNDLNFQIKKIENLPDVFTLKNKKQKILQYMKRLIEYYKYTCCYFYAIKENKEQFNHKQINWQQEYDLCDSYFDFDQRRIKFLISRKNLILYAKKHKYQYNKVYHTKMKIQFPYYVLNEIDVNLLQQDIKIYNNHQIYNKYQIFQ